MTDKELITAVWEAKVDHRFPWNLCVEDLKINHNFEITPQEAEKRFLNYFEETTGIKPYTKCPLCQNKLVPRKSRYGYFVGCSTYPKCTFKALPKK